MSQCLRNVTNQAVPEFADIHALFKSEIEKRFQNIERNKVLTHCAVLDRRLKTADSTSPLTNAKILREISTTLYKMNNKSNGVNKDTSQEQRNIMEPEEK